MKCEAHSTSARALGRKYLVRKYFTFRRKSLGRKYVALVRRSFRMWYVARKPITHPAQTPTRTQLQERERERVRA